MKKKKSEWQWKDNIKPGIIALGIFFFLALLLRHLQISGPYPQSESIFGLSYKPNESKTITFVPEKTLGYWLEGWTDGSGYGPTAAISFPNENIGDKFTLVLEGSDGNKYYPNHKSYLSDLTSLDFDHNDDNVKQETYFFSTPILKRDMRYTLTVQNHTNNTVFLGFIKYWLTPSNESFVDPLGETSVWTKIPEK